VAKLPYVELLCFFVQRLLFAKLAVFVELQSIRVIFFVFIGLIIALFAFCAGQCYRVAHPVTPLLPVNIASYAYLLITLFLNVTNTIYHNYISMSIAHRLGYVNK
jgi:hypothetical protein